MSTGTISTGGLTRRQLMTVGTLGLTGWMLSPIRIASAALQDDLELVSGIPQMAEREGPMLVFRDFVADPDVEVEQHIRSQVGLRKDLLDMVRKKTGFKKQVKLSLEDTQVRLMFVPQLPNDHSAAYHRYCLGITDYLFKMNQNDNFYAAITSPKDNYPTISETGISAFVVHRLAKDYRAVCRWTAESGRSVKFKATGAIFSNHLGAVDLEISLLAQGQFGLARKAFTIWQNNTENLYTLMSVPVEETLHYLLGPATDREIAEAMRLTPPESLAAAKRLADDWMAVEESVVGGLVTRVLDHYYDRCRMINPLTNVGVERPAVPSLPQYRYRAQGIQLVQQMGYQKAMALYMDSPSMFKEELFRHRDA